MTSLRKECESYLRHADEKANMSQKQSVPGDSPACYVGDSSNDVLKIKALDLAFNPPRERIVSSSRHLTLDLQGEIKEGIGLKPQLYVSVYLNGHLGPSVEQTLCAGGRIEISQTGVPLSDGQTPTDGNIMIRYSALLLDTELKKGYHTARVEMYASEEVGKARITGFEGGVWIEGGKGDGCGGWE